MTESVEKIRIQTQKNKIIIITTKQVFGRKEEQQRVENPPATNGCMKPDNKFFFFGCEAFMFEIWPQVISPSKPTTFTTSPKPCKKKEHSVYCKFDEYHS